MRKKGLALLLACLLAMPAWAVGEDDAFAPVTFTDGAGRQVTVTEKPLRVAVLFSSFAQMWQDAGGDMAVTVGETVERGFAETGVLLVDEGAGKTISTELLLSYAPDLIIASLDIPAQVDAVAVAEKAGIPCALFQVESFWDYLDVFATMTAITGDDAAYEEKGAQVQRDVQAVLDGMQQAGTRILFIRAGSGDASTKAKGADDHFAAAMLREMGCVNIADESDILLDGLSMEAILMADPDCIFFSLMGNEAAARAHVEGLLRSSVWGQLTAVKEGRAYILPKNLFHFKPNSDWADAYQYLAEILLEE